MSVLSGPAQAEHTLTQDDFAAFARLSGDDNPIHLDAGHAARTHFGRTVAHGALLCALLRGLVSDARPGPPLARLAVTFPAPAYADEALVFRADPQDDTRVRLLAQRQADGQAVCEGVATLAPLASSLPPDNGWTDPLGGSTASVTRLYADADLGLYERLTGHRLREPLVLSLFSFLLGTRLPGPGTNYLKQETVFSRRVPLDAPLDATVTITRLRPDKRLVDLATVCRIHAGGGRGETVATGRALVLAPHWGPERWASHAQMSDCQA
ncbi:MaoC/PaaZ C-terminal domain-containing protein [Nitrospirillum sp. BR 11828]|uniref:MaoC family dehydratase n=1 Tax=Nitrospirillum sp. BR 11828 TaxID=3104325 RepID=UPI002ACA8980|nr:MaoC/PaaZ C-terminal domain-containing protein [Nitrospirillum sp. BR 11828]MDZ5650213.1 MaoC/PaaZ C-terminal domain-containing protein [Nitrospirillum sp. BR 11828]